MSTNTVNMPTIVPPGYNYLLVTSTRDFPNTFPARLLPQPGNYYYIIVDPYGVTPLILDVSSKSAGQFNFAFPTTTILGETGGRLVVVMSWNDTVHAPKMITPLSVRYSMRLNPEPGFSISDGFNTGFN